MSAKVLNPIKLLSCNSTSSLRYSYLSAVFDPKLHTPLDANSLHGTLNGRMYDHIKGLSTFFYNQTCTDSSCAENKRITVDKYSLQQRFSVDDQPQQFQSFVEGIFLNYSFF